MFAHVYRAAVLERPLAALLVMAALVVFFAFQSTRFELDASADSLLLENDEDLRLSLIHI